MAPTAPDERPHPLGAWEADPSAARTIDRRPGRAGELALIERDGQLEIVSNGVFLMDTRDPRSERALVRVALAGLAGRSGDGGPGPRPVRALRVLIAGLGVGSSLAEALASPDVGEVLVVEWEPAVVAWNRTLTGPRTGGSVDDPRVRCEVTDVVGWLSGATTPRFDVVCLDVDNGPHWTVVPGNRWLYTDEGLVALRDRLTADGVVTVWSAAHVPAFERRLRRRFGDVRRLELPVDRGDPDVVYVARR